MKEGLEYRCLDNPEEEPSFVINLLGNEYCKLKPSMNVVRCAYISPFPDHNEMYQCMYSRCVDDYKKRIHDILFDGD